MKKLILTPIFALFILGSSILTAQNWSEEYLGLPGDNLNLFAVMNLFQESETLEGFERSLNDPETMINNLDLVGDGYVDYIMVFDYKEGDVHNIVLRVALNQYEYQDVAVFVVRTLRSGAVQVQLIGDEALYGPNYIVEPNYAETPNPAYRGKVNRQRNVNVVTTTYYEIATWPVIVYIHRPYYRVWRSPWRWAYYPVWWHTWTPHYWHFYYGYHYNWYGHYYTYYRPWRHHRCGFYRNYYYTGIRRHSTTVVVNINRGSYRNTYNRPEKRREGEVLFTQRHSSGRTVPGGNTAVNTRGGRHETQTNTNVGIRTSGSENQRRVAAPTNNRTARDNNAVRQNSGAGQNARVTNSSENRRPAVQNSSTQRRQNSAAPARNENRQPTNRVSEPQRRQVTNSPARTENRQPANRVSERQRRETAPAPNRNVSRSAPERNTSAPRNAPSSVSPGRNSSQPSSVGRSEPARAPRQSAPSVRSSGSNNRSGNSGTKVQRSGSSNNRSSAAPQRTQSSGQSRSSRPSGR
ncbi:MAG: hypothetical protein EA393_05250 [Bacteroidetes bacterium]|nr:MAG: hypothetical protein EA393_05250 [Bacteroidota bacterium]